MPIKYLYKYASLAVAFSLAAVLISCGGNIRSETAEKETVTIKTASSEKNNAGDADPFGKYDPPLAISFVRGIDEDFANNVLPKTPGETVQDNRWLRLYSDKLGIDVKYAWAVRGNETSEIFTQKMNVTLAAGNLPDITLVNPAQLRRLVDYDMVSDMTGYFDSYASPLTKVVYNQEGTATLDSVTINGKLMAIPEPYSFVERAQYIWIRRDWLKKLDLKPPRTMEELLAAAEAFSASDPDGNGRKDTYGIAITKNLYGGCMGTEGFFAGYHAYPNMWVEDASGKLVWGSTLPETKKALGKLAEMFRAGVIDREFSVKDDSKNAGTIIAGKVGIEYGEQWNPLYPLISNYNNDNNADWVGYPLISADDKKVMVPLKYNQTRILAVRKGYAHPEALVKLINIHLEMNWGQKADFNTYYMPVENGGVGVWKFSPVTPTPPYKNLNAFLAIEKARSNNSQTLLQGEAKAIQSNLDAYASGDKTKWGWEKIYGTNGVLRILEHYRSGGQLLAERFVGPPSDTVAEKKAVMDKLENEVFIKIIMGEAPVDDFDKFVNDWYKIGGKEITLDVNSWYDSHKGK